MCASYSHTSFDLCGFKTMSLRIVLSAQPSITFFSTVSHILSGIYSENRLFAMGVVWVVGLEYAAHLVEN